MSKPAEQKFRFDEALEFIPEEEGVGEERAEDQSNVHNKPSSGIKLSGTREQKMQNRIEILKAEYNESTDEEIRKWNLAQIRRLEESLEGLRAQQRKKIQEASDTNASVASGGVNTTQADNIFEKEDRDIDEIDNKIKLLREKKLALSPDPYAEYNPRTKQKSLKVDIAILELEVSKQVIILQRMELEVGAVRTPDEERAIIRQKTHINGLKLTMITHLIDSLVEAQGELQKRPDSGTNPAVAQAVSQIENIIAEKESERNELLQKQFDSHSSELASERPKEEVAREKREKRMSDSFSILKQSAAMIQNLMAKKLAFFRDLKWSEADLEGMVVTLEAAIGHLNTLIARYNRLVELDKKIIPIIWDNEKGRIREEVIEIFRELEVMFYPADLPTDDMTSSNSSTSTIENLRDGILILLSNIKNYLRPIISEYRKLQKLSSTTAVQIERYQSLRREYGMEFDMVGSSQLTGAKTAAANERIEQQFARIITLLKQNSETLGIEISDQF